MTTEQLKKALRELESSVPPGLGSQTCASLFRLIHKKAHSNPDYFTQTIEAWTNTGKMENYLGGYDMLDFDAFERRMNKNVVKSYYRGLAIAILKHEKEPIPEVFQKHLGKCYVSIKDNRHMRGNNLWERL